MSRFEPLRASLRRKKHIRTHMPSYDGTSRKVNQPLRLHYPNLSPTRPPAVAADAALWPAWTDAPVEVMDLDDFDDHGFHLGRTGGRS